MQIAIDGPASSGKSTIAKIIAKKFNFIYIDTGAMYRALTYCALKNHVNFNHEFEIVKILKKLNYEIKIIDGVQHFFVMGQDVTQEIRKPVIAQHVSQIAAYPQVRKYLSQLQQNLAKNQNVVMDGRDIGTVILPQAEFKFFLTATPEVRAKRRYLENQSKGIHSDLAQLTAAIVKRDQIDSSRQISPLKRADDAVLVDTSHLTIKQVVALLIDKIQA